jgi:hypothetical protein
MKKIFVSLLSVIAFVGLFVCVASAASSITLSPSNVSPKVGSTFKVMVSIDPHSVSNTTVKLELKYPADLLEATAFTFGTGQPGWVALAQPGYDSIDNTSGTLIKTAGYPNGFSTTVTFGTVTFKAKKTGNGTITIGNGSMALDSNSQNVLSQSSSSVTVSIPAQVSVTPTPKPITQVSPDKTQTPPVESVIPQEPTPAVEQPVAQTVSTQNSFVAAVGNVLMFGTGSILINLIILAIVAYAIYALIQRKRKNLGGM